MQKFNCLFLVCFSYLGIVSYAVAQNDADMVRYSKLQHGGSARFEAMGGAFGALGADISAVQINPAAMGRFSTSQVSLTVGPIINQSTATLVGTETKDSKFNFFLPSFGLVLTKDLSARNKGDMYSQFSVGMNRIGNFNQKMSISGEQFPSMLDGFIGQAQGVAPENLRSYFPFSTYLAYEAYAIDYDPDSGEYLSYLNSGNMKMNRDLMTKGGVNEFYLSYSRNRLNRLYYGFSFNIRTYRYLENYKHSEDLVLADPNFVGFDYEYALKTTGTGANLKLGVIYLVSNSFRIGGAFHTPTYISFQDKWSATMTSRFTDGFEKVPEDLVPKGDYKYNMITPLKAVFSTSYVIGLSALISADVEYVGYKMTRLRSTRDIAYDPYDYKIENEDAKNRLTDAVNVRVGAEFNIQQKFFLRAGFAYYGNAYKKSELVDVKPELSYSGGLGYKLGNVNFDLSYINRTLSRNYYPFVGSNSALIQSNIHSINISATVRF